MFRGKVHLNRREEDVSLLLRRGPSPAGAWRWAGWWTEALPVEAGFGAQRELFQGNELLFIDLHIAIPI